MDNPRSGSAVCDSDTYEEQRLESLHRLGLLDTPPSEAFDRIRKAGA